MNLDKQNAGVRKTTSNGFTLIELMIAVAIVAILAVVALPSYWQYVVRSNRSAAESFMLSVANKQEQYLLDARQYATTLAALGFTDLPSEVKPHYDITFENVTTTTYTVRAAPKGTQASNDTQCGILTLSHAGAKTPASGCW